jgi:hypothetical protein
MPRDIDPADLPDIEPAFGAVPGDLRQRILAAVGNGLSLKDAGLPVTPATSALWTSFKKEADAMPDGQVLDIPSELPLD